MIATAPATAPRATTRERLGHAVLAVALLVHLSLLASWRLGFWDRFTFDSTSTRGDRGWDLFALYQAGRNVLDGISAYESDNEQIRVVVPRYTPYRYLPTPAYTLGVALNLVSPLWAFRLWVAAVEAVLLGCAYVTWRLAGRGLRGALGAALWLAYTPYYLEIYLGQFTLVQAALVFAVLLAWERRAREWLADLPWTLSLLWKQNSGLLLPVYVRLGRWRGILLASGAVLALSVPYFLRYPEALHAFVANFNSGAPGAQLGNLGVRQFMYSALSALVPALSPQGHAVAQTIWALSVAGVGLWVTFRPLPRGRRPDAPLLGAMWISAYLLVYHHVWEHHYVLLLPVMALLWLRGGERWVLVLWALLAVWTPYRLVDPTGLAAYHMPMRWTPLEPAWVDVAYHASKAVPALVLWAYLVWRVWRGDRAGEGAGAWER